MSGKFVHLHLKTDYSLLRSACRIRGKYMKNGIGRDDLVSVLLEQNSPAAAVTDFFTLGALPEFFSAMSGAGIKPVAGCGIMIRSEIFPGRLYPLILLVRNETGFRNLCRILYEADPGKNGAKSVSLSAIAANREGLTALSGGPEGELSFAVLDGEPRKTELVLAQYLDLFGTEHFHPEVTDHGLDDEKIINRGLAELARSHKLRIAASNEVCCLRKNDVHEFAVISSIRTGSPLKEQAFSEYYCKSPEEMYALFGTELPEALSNTLEIAERCEFRFDFHRNLFPDRISQEGKTAIDELRTEALANLPRLFGESGRCDKIRVRLERELDIIERRGLDGYFVAMRDLVRHAKERGIPVGQTEYASGAECLTAYLCGITDLDPVENGLFFELFLNSERKHPEISLSVSSGQQDEMRKLIAARYGADHTAGTYAFHPFDAKTALREAARILDIPSAEVSQLIRRLPSGSGLSLRESLERSSELREFTASHDPAGKLIETAVLAEGGIRMAEEEPDTLLIGSRPLIEILPLVRNGQGFPVSEFSSAFCRGLGLMRVRFSGSYALSLIRNVLDEIRKRRGKTFEISRIPTDDPRVFDLLKRGETASVPGIESGPLQLLCERFAPDSMKDLTALFAVSKAGMKQFAPSLAARKRGEESFEYAHPLIEELLEETYGLVLYREQCAEILRLLAGIPYERTEDFCRSLKNRDPFLPKQHDEFLDGCSSNGIERETAEKIFAELERTGGGTGKANCAASALTAYRTAYLKVHAPLEFFVAALALAVPKQERISHLAEECGEFGIPILLPDINRSSRSFVLESGRIRAGLSSIRGISDPIAENIADERERNGSFADFPDFLRRCGAFLDLKILESLIRSGAFDSMRICRSRMLAVMDEALRISAAERKERESGQESLFSFGGSGGNGFVLNYPELPELDEMEMRQDEKRILGFDQASSRFESGTLLIRLTECSAGKLESLKALLEAHRGNLPVMLSVPAGNGCAAVIRLSSEFCVDFSKELKSELERSFGPHRAEIINERGTELLPKGDMR